MNEIRDSAVDTAERMLVDMCTAAEVNAADHGGLAVDLWKAVETCGLHRVCLAEEEGGVGLSLAEGLPIVRTFARYAAPVPIAEALLASVLLKSAKLAMPEGVVTVAETKVLLSQHATGMACAPFARHATHVVLWHPEGNQLRVALLNVEGIPLKPGENMAGEPRDMLDLRNVPLAGTGIAHMDAEDLLAQGALLRSAQLVGAMEKILDLAHEHVTTRVQFGRPLSAFQAIQHSLVIAIGESAAARAAVEAAGAVSGDTVPILAVATAKIRAGTAGTIVARVAHQSLGAMGYTHEHSLHQYTRRIWAWRDEFGRETDWARRLGAVARSKTPEEIWKWITEERVA